MSKFNKASYEKTDKRRKYDNKIKRREAARQYVWDYLSTHPCVECGDSDPRSLEFDHIRGPKKESVSVLANGDYALDRVKIEISILFNPRRIVQIMKLVKEVAGCKPLKVFARCRLDPLEGK